MLLRRISVQNVRSFLDRAELLLDGKISIIIGPNGGGKTNLLDSVVVALRRHLFASMYAIHSPSPENQNRHEFRHNEVLNGMVLEKHSAGGNMPQIIEVEVAIAPKDIINMRAIQKDAEHLSSKKYIGVKLMEAKSWDVNGFSEGERFLYRIVDGQIEYDGGKRASDFLHYLQIFEMDGYLRGEFEIAPLSMPMIYLPVNRAASGFKSSIELAGYNDYEVKRQSDAVSSRSGTQIINLAIGRMAQKYRLLIEKDNGVAVRNFREDANLKELTEILQGLGYEWALESVNPLKNQYDVRIKKQGSSFLVGAASSGERELLTYLFAIFALNVRDALIVVDEPELHLHPKWQKTLLKLFIKLERSTGNQFILATHSPTFVSPESINYVSRVFSENQKSNILRLDASNLPESKHLLGIVNSQNNERLFFADEVVLVEGLSDRIFFEALLSRFENPNAKRRVLEVVSVGGKGLFGAYGKILKSAHIKFSIIADLDYVEQIGTPDVKGLFALDAREIKVDVIENVKSYDGDALVKAIDDALVSGGWGDAVQLWDYIKSRRRRLKASLSVEDGELLKNFIEEKSAERIYLLGLGTLEDYLPVGYRSKDLEKLIRFLSSDFWSFLPPRAQDELHAIVNKIIDC